jgi:hypothetical protein
MAGRAFLYDDDLDELDGASCADHVAGHLALVESEHAEVVGADPSHLLVVGGSLREPALELVHDQSVDRRDVQLVRLPGARRSARGMEAPLARADEVRLRAGHCRTRW